MYITTKEVLHLRKLFIKANRLVFKTFIWIKMRIYNYDHNLTRNHKRQKLLHLLYFAESIYQLFTVLQEVTFYKH